MTKLDVRQQPLSVDELLQLASNEPVVVVNRDGDEFVVEAADAFDREAAMKLHVYGKYTYTMETLIQAGAEGLSVMSVPIDVNPQTRESRLVKSSFAYVRRSASTIIRSYAIYRPFRFFAKIAAIPALAGVVLVVRWLYYFWFVTPYESRIPSLVAGGVLILVGIQFLMIAFLAEMISISRRLLSESRFLARQAELDSGLPRR